MERGGYFVRRVGNVFAIRPIGYQDWELSIFGRDWTIHVAANGQVAIFEGNGDVLFEDQAVFVVGVDFMEVSDLEGHFEGRICYDGRISR
jgi:hypothetical protein